MITSSEIVDVIYTFTIVCENIYRDWWCWKTFETIMVAINVRAYVMIQFIIYNWHNIVISIEVEMELKQIVVVLILISSYHE